MARSRLTIQKTETTNINTQIQDDDFFKNVVYDITNQIM